MPNAITWTQDTLKLKNGENHPIELGELLVPEDHFAADSRTIKLRFARLASPKPNSPTVMFLAGGPGDSGIQWAQHPPFFKSFDTVRQGVNLILLDQRGCGTSERNLKCLPPTCLKADSLATKEGLFAFYAEHLKGEAERLQVDGKWYTPWQSAHDIDALRNALGLETVCLWGYSYGTHLTQAAMKLMGSKVDRAVMCGFEGPDQTWKLPSAIHHQLSKLDILAATQPACGTPYLLKLMARVHERLANEPIEVPDVLGLPTLKVGLFALQHLVSTWVGVSNRFIGIPRLYQALDKGDTAPLADALKGFAKTWTKPLSFYLKDSASGASLERLWQIAKEAPKCILSDAINFPFPAIGEVIGAHDLGDAFREPLKSVTPTLVLTGSLDGNTPTEQAHEGLKLLPNGKHLLIEAAAHNDLISSDEGVYAIARFLEDGGTPDFESVEIPMPRFTPYQ